MATSGLPNVGKPAPRRPSDSKSSEGMMAHTTASAGGTVNRKKAKRRAKQAAKQAATQPNDGFTEHIDLAASQYHNGSMPQSQQHVDAEYDDQQNYGEDGYADGSAQGGFVYSDEDDEFAYDPEPQSANGASAWNEPRAPRSVSGTGKGKKRMNDYGPAPTGHPSQNPLHARHGLPHRPRPPHTGAPRGISDDALRTVQRGINSGIWNTSSGEERQRIKEYWLSLGEDERKALVKIEKNDVLKKMKDQQKHSCSCTVCGRKRVAIEEELEVLYDAYYQELEQYANHNQQLSENGTPALPPTRRYSHSSHRTPTNGHPPPPAPPRTERRRVTELPEGEDDEEEPEEDDLEAEEYSDEEYDDEEYSDEEDDLPPAANEFFTFGKSLTVKGGILTVADDLLKNDGQKFIDMMEQLAERRMQREEAYYTPYSNHASAPPPQHTHTPTPHTHAPPEEEEYDDEEDEDYDSQDDEYEEEDEVDTMTEGQRMDEGRRMFQIFAARMFEQRVLSAYREKRAMERQQAFLRDLENEEKEKAEASTKNAAKKAKQRQKEKVKKEALKEEKARKAEEKAAAEAAEEQRKQDEKRKRDEENRRKEEERKKKLEDARRKQEEEKQRKKAEEREREDARREKERKAKEKKDKEDATRKERELKDRETKLQQEREEKERQENERREREAKEQKRKADMEAYARQTQLAESTMLAESKRQPPAPVVALPPSLKTKQSYTVSDSPQAKIATPAVPKPPTPVRPKEVPIRTSQSSLPLNPESAQRPKPATPPKLLSQQLPSQQLNMLPSRTPSQSTTVSNTPHMSPMHAIPPPPGMPLPHQNGPPMGMHGPNGYPGVPGPMMPGMMQRMPIGHQMPMYSPHVPQLGPPHRGFYHNPATGAPPGITPPMGPQHPRTYVPESVLGAGQAPLGAAPNPMQQSYHVPRENAPPTHSRQTSSAFDASPLDTAPSSAASQPIARPVPIKRPTSTKPYDLGLDLTRSATTSVDELGTRLGSSALLDDSDEPLPTPNDTRRVSSHLNTGLSSIGNTGMLSSPFDQTQSPFGLGSNTTPTDSWRSSSLQYGPTGTSGWGSAPTSTGWGGSGGFSMPQPHRGSVPKPVTVRILACQACRSLARQTSGIEGFHDFKDIVRLVTHESARQGQMQDIQAHEIRNILETEGDTHNGGGMFIVREDIPRARTLVKWVTNAADQGMGGGRPAMGLGEIGSPLPSNSIPMLGGPIPRGF